MATRALRIGVDVGGTFTDFVLADPASGALAVHKEPSTPSDPSAAVESGTMALLAQVGAEPADVALIAHGTTIGLNAIIQRRGARLGLVVSPGNRDILEIARLRMPSSYDVTAGREDPLAPRDLVFEIEARMTSRGAIVARPDAAALAALAEALRAAGVEAVAVCLLNAWVDGSLEAEIGAALVAALPGVGITLSSAVWPEIREYERCMVAALNASIQPLMTGYFDRLERRLAARGVVAPIHVTANNGGAIGLDTARARPIETVLSGPASGVSAAARVAQASGLRRLITFDMGGTSADIAICSEGAPEFTAATQVGDFPLMMPVVNVSAIGAGGGSVVWLDPQGLLKVGPMSAGAEPGPACYGRGGMQPTVTDCYVALGYIDPARFLGGAMALDAEAALAALDRVAAGLGMNGTDRARDAAAAALRVASARMAAETTKLLAQAGADPREYALVAFGGAGPTHATLLAEEAGIGGVVAPPSPGAFCALGAVLAEVRRDYARTARKLLAPAGVLPQGRDGWADVAALLDAMEAEARDWLARETGLADAYGFAPAFDLRYPGQAYELKVIFTAEERAGLDVATVCDRFHALHHKLYGFSRPDSPVQSQTLRLAVVGRGKPIALPAAPPGGAVARGSRAIRIGAATHEAAVYDRAGFGDGAEAAGPAIIEQADTTTIVPPGWRARADRIGALHLRREGAR